MGTLVCPLCCDDKFPNQLSLRQHLLGVVKNVHCPDCNEKFETILQLTSHLDGMCGNAVGNIKDEEMLELFEKTEDKEIVIGEKVKKVQLKEDSQHAENGDSTVVFIKTEMVDENAIVEDTHLEDFQSISVKSDIDVEDSQINSTEIVEQPKDNTSSLQICFSSMGKYKRTSYRQTWNEDCMRNAIKDVINRKMGYLKASKVYGVPRTTLEGRVMKVRRGLVSVENSAEKDFRDGRSWNEDTNVDSETFEEEMIVPDSSLCRSSCSKCGVNFKSVAEHASKFHNGLNINMNVSRKSRQTWKKEDMKAAIIAVRNRVMGVKKASKCFNVPRTTLIRKARSKEENIEKLITSKLGRKPTLSAQLEKTLVSHCLEMTSRFCNLSNEDIKRMAFKLASMNCTSHPFSKINETAGRKWLRKFVSRHPYLKRKQQSKSSFNLENIQKFFDVFEPLMAIIENMPSRLYNYDVTAIGVMKRRVNKIIYLKEKNEIGLYLKSDRCSLVTLVTCMNAVGHFLPPLLIMPRMNVNPEILDDGPDGPLVICHQSGWIEDEILVSWLKMFLNSVKPSKDDPIVLVMGCHHSYMWNIEFLELARENGVHLICLPPQSTNKMQSLEVGLMQSFKSHFTVAFESWQKQNEDRVIPHLEIGKLVCETFKKSATLKAAADGFKKTGLFPCRRNIFNDYEFLELQDDDRNIEESTEISLFDSTLSANDDEEDDDDYDDEN